MMNQENLRVSTLGTAKFPSPLTMSTVVGDGRGNFTPDDARILCEIEHRAGEQVGGLGFEKAGARQHLYFDSAKTRAAVVTCGGLCPGINNVIRSLFFHLTVNYRADEVLGIRYGYEGLVPGLGQEPFRLNRELVGEIHKTGGTILGTSRGHQEPSMVVDFLVAQKVDMLFCVGGDGTQKGAHAISCEIARRKLPIAIVGIPKTIDNDVMHCFRSFGYLTAVQEAERIIGRAHTEARSIVNGISLVKLMGREAGFIAAGATIASGHVNFTMIPEVPLRLEGDDGLLAKLERRLAARQHAVLVVAEGAGQDLLPDRPEERDASGNRKLGDIGRFLKERIDQHMEARGIGTKVRYFDPSYSIRSCPANTGDSLLCEQMARNAVHAAMAGKTDLLIGFWHNHFVHVPLGLSAGEKQSLSPESSMWVAVLAMTGQEKW